MIDVHSTVRRSFNMSRIRGKNTGPERVVKKMLRSSNISYRSNSKNLPGKPDIVVASSNSVVFVHGCFWHRHKDCKYTTNPKSNEGFWQAKFANTIERDRKQISALQKLGWKVIVIWECELKHNAVKLQSKLLRTLKPDRSKESWEKRELKGLLRG